MMYLQSSYSKKIKMQVQQELIKNYNIESKYRKRGNLKYYSKKILT